MASNTAESEVVFLEKMFVWKLKMNDHDKFLKLSEVSSPKMTSVDPYNGTKYTGIFNLKKDPVFAYPNGYRGRGARTEMIKTHSFSIDINPNPGTIVYGYLVVDDEEDDEDVEDDEHDEDDEDGEDDEDNEEVEGNALFIRADCKSLCFYAHVIFTRQCSSPLLEMKSVTEKLKQLWKDDPSVKFLIKCKGNTIETSKPFMAASSHVFKAMFDRDWKELTENSIEIVDFDPEVVRHMVEFCENGTITDVEEFEELYKIADKYDIQELMKLTLAKFDQTMTIENVHTRLQMAEQYELKDLRKRCRVFCALNDIDF